MDIEGYGYISNFKNLPKFSSALSIHHKYTENQIYTDCIKVVHKFKHFYNCKILEFIHIYENETKVINSRIDSGD